MKVINSITHSDEYRLEGDEVVDLRDLTIFVAVAKTRSVTRAAEQLGYVQSNITARIQNLEHEFDTTLFHRLSRGMAMTSNGEKLLIYAEKILHLCIEAEQAVRDTETPSGTLRIGAIESATAIRLPTILAKYHEAFPNVELSLATGSTSQLLDFVLNYDIEAALVTGPVDHPSLQQVAVIEESLVLVSSSKHNSFPSANNQVTVLAFREGCSYRNRLEQYLDGLGVKSIKVIELGTFEGILGCVAAGLGVSLVPRKVASEARYTLAVHQIPDRYGIAPTVLVRRKDGFISSALTQFIETVRSSVHSLQTYRD